jgi:hypothetical protein
MAFINDASGRMVTDYRSSCVVNEQIKAQNGIKDNYQYRLFLQRNALEIMNKDRKIDAAQGCGKCQNCVLNQLQNYKN